jgi:hypothetical protein
VKLGIALVICLALALPATAAQEVLPRSTADRADEVSGPQIHAIYVVPADGTDRGLDTDGTIERTVRSWNTWLASQTAGKGSLRLDTYGGGTLDVTFYRDAHTDAEIQARDPYVRDQLEGDLRAAHFVASDKIYAVYYDGASTYACGGGAYPPTLEGNVAAMYLHGLVGQPVPCDSNDFVPNGQPGYLEFAMVHEILHTLGFVPGCAPHQFASGHVSEPTNDLMYAGSEPWSLPPTLDVGHDDYFLTGRTDCPDLASSPYLTANPPPPAAPVQTSTPTTKSTPKAKPKVKPKPKIPKCKKHQHSIKKKPCHR